MAKSKYEEVKSRLLEIEAWCRDGLTYDQIAKNLGISKDTLWRYAKEHPDFSDALKKSRAVADIEVENALYKSALGYEYEEVTEELMPIRDSQGTIVGHRMTETKRVTKFIPPSNTAQIFWLKNRKPAEWRDKQDIEHTGGISYEIILPDDLKD